MQEKKSITDFGKIIIRELANDVYASSLSDVSKAYRDYGKNITPVGTSHTMMGQSLSKFNSSVRRTGPHEILVSKNIVEASSHSTILDIDTRLRDEFFEMPISPDHRELSLGGVLSVGGYDPMSVRKGALVDSVESLVVVLRDGSIIKTKDRKFLCNLGENGFIWSAKINLSNLRDSVYVNSFKIDYECFVDRIPSLIGDKSISGFHFGKDATGSVLEVVGPINDRATRILDYRSHRKKVTDTWAFREKDVFRPWSDTFVPISKGKDFFNFCLDQIYKCNIEERFWSIFSIVCKRGNADHFPHTIGEDLYSLGVGVYVNIPLSERSSMIQVVDSQFKISEYAKKIGGKSCLHGWSLLENKNYDSCHKLLVSMGM